MSRDDHHLQPSGDYTTTNVAQAPLRLQDVKLGQKPLASNASASLWDAGDGVACLEFHSKLNTIDFDTMAMGLEAVEIVSKSMRALLIHSEAPHFSAGANLGKVIAWTATGDWNSIEAFIDNGQAMMKAFKFAPFPVVAAPKGLALGGGCEILLHCAAVQAYAELTTGLVELSVGLVPGWGGCKEMLIRQYEQEQKNPKSAVLNAFGQIVASRTSKSAADAKEMKILRPGDCISTNVDRLFDDAKSLALRLADTYQAPQPLHLQLPGLTAEYLQHASVLLGHSSPHDLTLMHHLAYVLCGGKSEGTSLLSEDDIINLEKQSFMALCKMPESQARMQAMLKTGKPLRN